MLDAAGPTREYASGEAQWPEVHRICDVLVDGQGWRVCRVVDSITGDLSLFLMKTDSPSTDAGFPYDLQGDALVEWVRAEILSPSKEPPPIR